MRSQAYRHMVQSSFARRAWAGLLLAAILILAAPLAALAAPGDLDTTFDTDGKVTTAQAGSDRINAVLVQPDGKILVAGAIGSDFGLARYTTAGALDSSFGGGDGLVNTNFGSSEEVHALALQGDGKIVAVGVSNNNFALARYNADGTPDNPFGGSANGRLTTDFGVGDHIAYAVVLQGDGKIVVAGVSNNNFAVARYTTAGALDGTFGGGDGVVTTSFGAGTEIARSVGLQSDGRIVAAGSWGGNFALARYTDVGVLDTTFGGGDGLVDTDFFTLVDEARALVVLGDDRIVAAGFADTGNPNNRDFALARYTAAGVLDTTFGGGSGKVNTDFATANDEARALVLLGDGKLAAAGYADIGPHDDFALARYSDAGVLDLSFGGGDGRVTTPFGSNVDDVANGLALQSDGKLVAAGTTGTGGSSDFVLARYLGGNAPVADDQSVTTNEDTPVSITLTGSDPDSDTITYTVVTTPTNGTLGGIAPNLVYTPTANFNGSDSFTFKVSDGSSDSNTATVSITVDPVDDPPVADDQAVTTDEDTPANITLTASDPDGDPLTWTVLTPPANGTLGGIAPNLVYTPTANFSGSDSFTFKVNDGTSDSNTATVSITVDPVNDPPVAASQAVTTTEDTPLNVTLAASDEEGDPLTYTVVTPPGNGTLGGIAPSLVYTPDADFNGSDSFTFQANDGTDDSNVATVSITVTPVNDAPVADSQAVTATEDTPLNVTLTGSDPDGDPITYTVVTSPTNGTLSGTAPNLIYTPDADFDGSDSFTFQVNDGASDSNTATVSITVDPVNDAPVAQSQAVTTTEDTPITITLAGSDVDGDNLTFSVVTSPTNGALGGIAPNLVYTPSAGFNGTDSIEFTVNDGTVDSAPATVTINVTPVNDLPVADSQAVTTTEDTPLAITLTGSDPDGDPITYTVATSPANGTLGGVAPSLVYTPDADFDGSDSFTFVVNDGTGDSAPATVTVNVTAVNDAPVANNQSVTALIDTARPITLTAVDVDGDTITYTVVTSPTNGTLTGTAPNLTYTPNTGYTGPDSFTFQAGDGALLSNVAAVSITVSLSNTAPVADSQAVTTTEDTPVNVTLTGSDADGDSLTYTVVTSPTNGALSGTAPNLTYTPGAGYSGPDSFTFQVSDGLADSNVATVAITVTAVNVAPVADSQAVTTTQGTPVNVTLTATDPDGDLLTYTVVTSPTNGALTGTAPNLVYTPNAGYSGPDSFTFKANDGALDSNVATVSITVTATNGAPSADSQAVSTDEDTPLNIALGASDPDGDPLIYTIVAGPANGTLSGTGANRTYTPAANYNGPDSFTFQVNDGALDSNVATVSITVNPVNDAPVANAQSVSTAEDTPVGVTLGGSDVDGDPLTFTVLTQPANGTLSGTAPNLTYTPAADFNGSDSFTFKVSDGTLDSNAATVSIAVGAVDDKTYLPLINHETE